MDCSKTSRGSFPPKRSRSNCRTRYAACFSLLIGLRMFSRIAAKSLHSWAGTQSGSSNTSSLGVGVGLGVGLGLGVGVGRAVPARAEDATGNPVVGSRQPMVSIRKYWSNSIGGSGPCFSWVPLLSALGRRPGRSIPTQYPHFLPSKSNRNRSFSFSRDSRMMATRFSVMDGRL